MTFNISHGQSVAIAIGLDEIRRLVLWISRRQNNKQFLKKCTKFIQKQRNHDYSGLFVNTTKPIVFDLYNVSHQTKVLGPGAWEWEASTSLIPGYFMRQSFGQYKQTWFPFDDLLHE